ncbi:MAG: polysaccharide deacetylase family protein [Spirochaetaceae bacterium]|jgi:peptidoglycan/xylan/chitin deacetylase (PgdA/CDA1 family)|nr:polysaccharide deacetylase family protein [Spirochaetaceae bacterium]
MKKKTPVFVLFLLLSLGAWGKIRFSGLDIAGGDRLLFTADSRGGGAEAQGALFYARLDSRSLSQLSAFPEKMEVLGRGKILLVHNAFGSLRIPVTGGLPQTFPGFPSFTGGALPGGRVETTSSSPDGRWLLYVDPSSYARGALILLDGETGRRFSVSAEIERPGRFFPALWSADSRGFLYSKGGRLYFYTVAAQTLPPDERYRLIGEGAINSVCRGSGEDFYYLRGSTVYRIRSDEFFLRTLYRGFLDMGTVAGRLPLEFDPNFDSFWIAPDGLSLVLCKGGRNILYYPLGIEKEVPYGSVPAIMAGRTASRIGVLWSTGGILTILFDSAPGSGGGVMAYRLNTAVPSPAFETLESPPAFSAGLSPDGKHAVFWGKNGLFLYDYQSWTLSARFSSDPVYSCIWLGNNELVLGGREKIERLPLEDPAGAKLLCLASVSRYGFEDSPEGPGRILGFSGGSWYITDGHSPWVPYRTPPVREASISSDRYRVYLEAAENGFFENVPMVRNSASVGTFPLFEREAGARRFSPAAGPNPCRLPESPDFLFAHGARGTRTLSLCFDLYDDDAGLSTVLDALNRFEIKATFFLNGEFIRRHPRAAGEIAEAGHEAASMFYAPMDLSDSRYRVDNAFIARGLARNEDEFFKAAKKELSLFWHPPYYAVSREIAAAAAEAGYRTIARDIDSRDWIQSGDARRLGIEQLTAAEMIDYIMDAKEGGSIIPIRLGALPGGRGDYLFNSLEILLDALVREGYEVVPLSTLIGKSIGGNRKSPAQN